MQLYATGFCKTIFGQLLNLLNYSDWTIRKQQPNTTGRWLIREPEPMVTEKIAKASIESRMAELVELLAAFPTTEIDPRAWSQLLVYAPAAE